MSINNIIIKTLEKLPFGLRSRIKNIPVAKQLQALLLKKYFSDKEFVATVTGGPAKGLVFPVKMPQDKLMWIGTWEFEFANHLQQMVKPGWVCYDIGGYKGYYAGIMALKGANEVLVFEPMPVNAQKIRKLISLNPQLPVRLEETAVSNTTGTTTFKLMPEETMGKLGDSLFQPDEKAIQQLEVESVLHLMNLLTATFRSLTLSRLMWKVRKNWCCREGLIC